MDVNGPVNGPVNDPMEVNGPPLNGPPPPLLRRQSARHGNGHGLAPPLSPLTRVSGGFYVSRVRRRSKTQRKKRSTRRNIRRTRK